MSVPATTARAVSCFETWWVIARFPPPRRAPTSLPPLKNSTVGDERTASESESARFPCRNTFTNFTSAPYASPIASYFGASASQGAHSVE